MAPNKPTSGKWVDLQMAIAAIAMTSVLAFWNMFAGPDKQKSDEKAAAQQQTLIVPTAIVAMPVPTAMPTIPPVGYTIIYSGAAPKPPVIIQSHGGGGNHAGGGGGGGAVTSTKSS